MRLPEHGRIRMGVKTVGRNGKAGMKSIDTFRFTSPDQQAIEQIAARYGGEAKPWHDDKASPRDQWEVITRTSEVRIFLPPDSLSIWYELWSGGGVARRCDGEVVQVPGVDDMIEKPCMCVAQNAMECKPYTRLTVILPEIRFGGGWRLETKGWEAVHEMPGMQRMIEQLQAMGIVEARLRLDKVQKAVRGQTRHYVVPRLLVDTTPMQMLEGGGTVAALAAGEQALPERPQLVAGPQVDDQERDWFDEETTPLQVQDRDDVIDVEVVEDDEPPPAEPSPRRSQNPALTKFVLGCVEVASRIEALDSGMGQGEALETELRHAIAWSVSKGRVDSSKELTSAELSDAIDAVEKAKENPGGAVRGLVRYRERPM